MRASSTSLVTIGMFTIASCFSCGARSEVRGSSPRCDAEPLTDPNNCGRCGHVCCGGDCVGGVCQPVLLAHGSSAISRPEGIAMDSTNVYWVESQGNRVLSCAKSGCASPTTVASEQDGTFSIAVSGRSLYWSNWGHAVGDMGALMWCPLEGQNKPTVLAIGVGIRDIAVSADAVYFAAEGGADAHGGLYKCPLTTCSPRPSVVSANDVPARGVTVDKANVYYTTDSHVIAYSLAGGGNYITLATNVTKPWGIAVDESSAYWIDYANGTVATCALAGCNETAATIFSTSTYEHPAAIAIDANDVYWAETDEGTVRACDKHGCSENQTILASNQPAPWGIAVDDACVYWTNANSGDVMKVAKP